MVRLGRGWRWTRRWLKKRFASRSLVLMYHRVAELPSDPQLLAVSPRHFVEHLEVLRSYAYPMHLQQLAESVRHGRVRDRAVVVTFDDGYADNLESAKPLLEHYEIPATVFAVSGQLGSQCEFWWDELERLFLAPGILPNVLQLRVKGREDQWELGSDATYSNQAYELRRGWHVELHDDPGPRQRVYRALHHLLHDVAHQERQEALADLRSWAGVGTTGRPSHRALTSEELIQLATGSLVQVGAHSVSHSALGGLPAAAQRDEIQRSKAELEKTLGRPVTSFAYPHGSGTAETVAIVREAGYGCACSSDVDAVWASANPFWLPRVVVRDWDGDTFARLLSYWLDR